MLQVVMVLLFLGGIIASILFAFKRQSKKFFISLGVVLVAIVGIGLSPSEAVQLALDQREVQSDSDGLALIAGETNNGAELTIDGEEVPLKKDGTFEYEVQLKSDSEQTIKITANYSAKEITQKVTVSPSSSFKKQLAALEQEKAEAASLTLAETAVKLAEASLKESDYNEAFELVSQLKTGDDDLTQRLKKVDSAIKLAAEDANNRKQAEDTLAIAESAPTKENYQSAEKAVALIQTDKEALEGRLKAVNTTIVAAEKEKEAEQKIANAQQAQETNELPNTQGNQADTSMVVLTTPTGKKYHSYKCGNGTYSESTLNQAEARGLTPCSKCF